MSVKRPEPGDDLLSFALKAGVSPSAIRGHPENRALFDRRSPHVLSAEDEIFVPEPARTPRHIHTGETHYVVYTPPRRTLHLCLRDDDGDPLQTNYSLCDFVYAGPKPKLGLPWPEELHGFAYQGVIHETLLAAVSRVTLRLEGRGETRELMLSLGRLDPVTTVRGVKARLTNLGLYCGDVSDPAYDGALVFAVRLFQRREGLAVTGSCDPQTRSRLEKVSGA